MLRSINNSDARRSLDSRFPVLNFPNIVRLTANDKDFSLALEMTIRESDVSKSLSHQSRIPPISNAIKLSGRTFLAPHRGSSPKGEARRYVANNFLNLIALILRGEASHYPTIPLSAQRGQDDGSPVLARSRYFASFLAPLRDETSS